MTFNLIVLMFMAIPVLVSFLNKTSSRLVRSVTAIWCTIAYFFIILNFSANTTTYDIVMFLVALVVGIYVGIRMAFCERVPVQNNKYN